MKKVATVGVTLLATLTLASCGYKGSNGTYDKDFIRSMENGLQARWNITDHAVDPNNPTKEEYSKAISKEYDSVVSYKNKRFKSDKLHEEALAYINAVKQEKDALNYVNESSFDSKWSKAYDKRTEAILRINKIYKIKVDKDNESNLSELTRNGDKVVAAGAKKQAIDDLIKIIKFKEVKDEDGYKTFDADVKNNSEYVFKSFGIKVQLKDKNGTVVETVPVEAYDWTKGQTTRFEMETEKSFNSYSIIKDYVD